MSIILIFECTDLATTTLTTNLWLDEWWTSMFGAGLLSALKSKHLRGISVTSVTSVTTFNQSKDDGLILFKPALLCTKIIFTQLINGNVSSFQIEEKIQTIKWASNAMKKMLEENKNWCEVCPIVYYKSITFVLLENYANLRFGIGARNRSFRWQRIK